MDFFSGLIVFSARILFFSDFFLNIIFFIFFNFSNQNKRKFTKNKKIIKEKKKELYLIPWPGPHETPVILM